IAPRASRVRIELYQVLKRFCRTHSTGRSALFGGPAWAGVVWVAMFSPPFKSARSALGEAQAPVVGVHESRSHKAECQVKDHDQEEDRNGLTGLIHRRGADVEQIGVSDGNRQARVLRQIQILAGHRWN